MSAVPGLSNLLLDVAMAINDGSSTQYHVHAQDNGLHDQNNGFRRPLAVRKTRRKTKSKPIGGVFFPCYLFLLLFSHCDDYGGGGEQSSTTVSTGLCVITTDGARTKPRYSTRRSDAVRGAPSRNGCGSNVVPGLVDPSSERSKPSFPTTLDY